MRFPHPSRAPGRILVLAACLLATGAPAGAQAPEAEAGGPDLALPAQEAFRDWPPPAMLERPYWLPWNRWSFQRAALFDRPILLTLTVPWSRSAQRMSSETLAHPEVLSTINRGYVSVLVNADRRPDVRERYGGNRWPVVTLLLPDGRPMLSQRNPEGVAMPIVVSGAGAEGMLFILEQGRIYFEGWRGLLEEVAQEWVRREGAVEPVSGAVDAEASDQMARWLLGSADGQGGGFGLVPKLVVPRLVEYAATRDGDSTDRLAAHARFTLEALVSSPLYDSRHGGVHRIAGRPDWEGIQYEKLLDVNVALIRDLVFALRAQDSETLRRALRETCSFLTSTLARPGGGFYNAQMADSNSADGGGYWTSPEPADPPAVDPLVLAGPNALAGGALLRAGYLLDDESLRRAGRGALDLVLERTPFPSRGAGHVLEPAPDGRRYLETQADVALGLLDGFECTGEPRYLRAARGVVDFALDNLRFDGESALRDHFPAGPALGLLSRPRHLPVPNARLARAALRLTHFGEGPRYREAAEAILGTFAGDLTIHRTEGIEAALAIEEWARDPVLVTVRGEPGGAEATSLRRAALELPLAWSLVRSDPAPGAVGARVARGGRITRVRTAEALRAAASAEPASESRR